MGDITQDQDVRLRMPVATDAEIDAAKTRGTFAFSSDQRTVAVCPDNGQDFVRLGIHPADAPVASSLGAGDLVLVVQGGILKQTTVGAMAGGGVWQPLDADLTAIAALTTAPFGRSLLTLAGATETRTAIGAPSISDLAGYQPLDADLTAIAGLTTTAFGRGLLTQADAASVRGAIGAGTSSFSGAYASLSGIPAAIDALDALTPAADRLPYFTNGTTAALATFSAFARALLDDADATTARTTLGAAAAADLAAYLTKNNPNFTGTLSQAGATRIDQLGQVFARALTSSSQGHDDVGAGPFWRVNDSATSPQNSWIGQQGADNGLILFAQVAGAWSEKWRFLQDGSLTQAGATRITAGGEFRGTNLRLTELAASVGRLARINDNGGYDASWFTQGFQSVDGGYANCIKIDDWNGLVLSPSGGAAQGDHIGYATWGPSIRFPLSDDTWGNLVPVRSGWMWNSMRSNRIIMTDGPAASAYRGEVMLRRWSVNSILSISGTTTPTSFFAAGTGNGSPSIPSGHFANTSILEATLSISTFATAGTAISAEVKIGTSSLGSVSIPVSNDGILRKIMLKVTLAYYAYDGSLIGTISGVNGNSTQPICGDLAGGVPAGASTFDIIIAPQNTAQTIQRDFAYLIL